MIVVTPEAADQIRKSAAEARVEEVCLRIAARLDAKGAIEYGMGFDSKADGDMQFECNDVKLVVSSACVELLSGATLDYVEINPGERRFIFINPNDPSHKPPKAAA